MPTILLSKNNELLRHLAAEPFHGLDLDLRVASSGDEAIAMVAHEIPDLVIVEADLPGRSGYDVATEVKARSPECGVILVLDRRISSEQMQRVAECGCNDVLIAPMSADELYDVVAVQLGMPRHGGKPFAIDIAELTPEGPRPIEAQVSNLSVDGARLLVPRPIAENTLLSFAIRVQDHGGNETLELHARVLWAQQGASDAVVIGASFEDLDDGLRERLAELTQWEIVEDTERTRIVLKGDITEAMNLDALLPRVVGRVNFDMSQVRYMNSLGVRDWVRFLDQVSAQGYEFHACSTAFIVQASTVQGMLGRGTVASFFAPYHCQSCNHQEEKLLQAAAILAADYAPPTFTCPGCNGQMVLDDIAERYFAFLRPPPVVSHDE